ncbi:Copine like protein [Aduncisulcus paluster]|uniref:Copine like protein n=1 Tax=Aduncisulcus paluster TaxID=2918883 RepID=A0ABQ5JTM1_9EUKA|nr:Copine like protein [Aduncisulcus paluster]
MGILGQYELKFRASNLKDTDKIGKSDPFLVVELLNKKSGASTIIGRSSVLKDTLNPNWPEYFIVPYTFESHDVVRVSIYDKDSPDLDNLHKHDFLDIDKKDVFGASDPYLCIYRSQEGSSAWSEVARTKVLKDTLNPIWPTIEVSIQSLCNGDVDRPVKIECYDYDKHSDHDFIGSAETTVSQMIAMRKTEKNLVLFNEKKHEKMKSKGKSYTGSGYLKIDKFVLFKKPSFLDYIANGHCDIFISCAIDFTSSNKNPGLSSSLHFISDGKSTIYEEAICAVASVLETYSSDRIIDGYGFGMMLEGQGVSHCFPLDATAVETESRGVTRLLEQYRSTLKNPKLSFAGPTVFHKVIEHVIEKAQKDHEYNCRPLARMLDDVSERRPATRYEILVIVTDGQNNDIKQSVDLIVSGSHLPLSIIVVGVGDEDFSDMIWIDGDGVVASKDSDLEKEDLSAETRKRLGGRLRDSKGEYAKRDIVQFVEFSKVALSPLFLAQETLAEIPDQILSYMTMSNVKGINAEDLKKREIQKLTSLDVDVDEDPDEEFVVVEDK